MRGSHSRSNTNTKLVSSEDKHKKHDSSDSSSLDDIKEVSSAEDNLELKQRQHTMKVSLNDVRGKESESPTKKKGGNSLLRALNKRKAQSILDLNSATSKIPEQEAQAFNEALGLNEEQIDYINNSK